jgi:alpha-N-arabinofuranosidase
MTVTGGGSWRQTIYYPYLHAAQFGRGEALNLNIASPVYDDAEFGPVPFLEAVATHDTAAGMLTVFAVNRSLDQAMQLDGDARQFAGYHVVEHITLSNPYIKAFNPLPSPRGAPRSGGDAALAPDGHLTATLPPASWNVIRFQK